ncbi:MAG: M20 family metallopeptidase [Phascolarctobacterium sp.]|nr:M20 family metallopeptidase [Phascolarctobacterium sp.]
MQNKVFEKLEAYQPEMFKLLEKLVNIDSSQDNPEGIEQIAKILGTEFAKLGFDINYHESNGPMQLIATRPNPGKPKVMFMGHMDTVFSKGSAAARPFKCEDGKFYGPGVMDMKSGLCMTVYILKALLESGYDDADLTVFFVGDEEVSHPYSDADKNFYELGKGKDMVFNMEPGRDHGEVTYGRKGVWRPLIKVKGIPTHAGNAYEAGASAILELAKKTVDLFAITDLEAGTTCNVGTFHGGTLPNIMAEDAECILDVRFTNIEEYKKAKAKIEEICSFTYDQRCKIFLEKRPGEFMPSFDVTEGGMRLFHFVQKIHQELGLGELKGTFVGGASDAAYTTQVGAPTLCSMGPTSVGAHSNNEFAYVDSYLGRCKLIAECLMRVNEFVANK